MSERKNRGWLQYLADEDSYTLGIHALKIASWLLLKIYWWTEGKVRVAELEKVIFWSVEAGWSWGDNRFKSQEKKCAFNVDGKMELCALPHLRLCVASKQCLALRAPLGNGGNKNFKTSNFPWLKALTQPNKTLKSFQAARDSCSCCNLLTGVYREKNSSSIKTHYTWGGWGQLEWKVKCCSVWRQGQYTSFPA